VVRLRTFGVSSILIDFRLIGFGFVLGLRHEVLLVGWRVGANIVGSDNRLRKRVVELCSS
jgi:hypothetical protein